MLTTGLDQQPTTQNGRGRSHLQSRRGASVEWNILQHKKASNGAIQVETQAKGLPTGLPTRTPSATVPGTHVAEHPRAPSVDCLVANKQQLESTTTDETLADARESSVPVAEEPQRMATPIRDHPNCQNACSGAGEDVRLPGLETCTLVQFESHDGTPGLRYTSASGEESWTTVTGKNPWRQRFATVIKDSRDVIYRQCEGALASFPGLYAQLLSLAVRKAGEGLDGFIT